MSYDTILYRATALYTIKHYSTLSFEHVLAHAESLPSSFISLFYSIPFLFLSLIIPTSVISAGNRNNVGIHFAALTVNLIGQCL